MTKRIEKFLEFNGKRITVLLADGSWWVAVRPICEALNINYQRIFQNLQDDEILSQLLAKQLTVGADKKMREMLCIPEMYVYGWLFSIRSESPDLRMYKLECYKVLYNHFHGTLTGRMTALSERSEAETRILELKSKLGEEMKQSQTYLEIQQLALKQKAIAKTLRDLDADLLAGQLSFNFT